MPRVSVYIPAHNAAEFIRSWILSSPRRISWTRPVCMQSARAIDP
jgi:hypothetical protein